MAAPKYEVIQTDYQNPHASQTMKLNMLVVGNTPDEQLEKNVRENSEKYTDWLQMKEAHIGKAVLIGGGWSINDCLDEIKTLKDKGATIVSMNGSAKWCRDNGITPDWQVIVDAKEETAELVDSECKSYFASQVDVKTAEKAKDLTLVHFGLESIEQFLPEERVKRGGYSLLGCGTTVGNAALSIVYALGYRDFHIFGYDSSYHEGHSHGYEQGMNQYMPTTKIKWAGREFIASVAMKGQAEKFPINALSLKNAGCELKVYGDGLLQTIYNTDYSEMTEQEKYQLMWNMESYRNLAPGEDVADLFVEKFSPEGTVIDFGCGTGRGSLKLQEHGLEPILLDFTDNCRDAEALSLQFIQHDLYDRIPVKAKYGFCTDVMEHIPTKYVSRVVGNIMDSVEHAFFQISTMDDEFGKVIGETLHHTVKPHEWWLDTFKNYNVEWDADDGNASLFYVSRQEQA